MKVSLDIYKALQRAVYDGEYLPELIPIYHEFAEFAETSFEKPLYARLLDGLVKLEVV